MEKLLTQLERALIILASLVILEAFGLVALAYKVSQKQTDKPDQMIHLTVTNRVLDFWFSPNQLRHFHRFNIPVNWVKLPNGQERIYTECGKLGGGPTSNFDDFIYLGPAPESSILKHSH